MVVVILLAMVDVLAHVLQHVCLNVYILQVRLL